MSRLTKKAKTCDRCGKRFRPRSNRQKYCSARCKQGTATCEGCGKTFVRKPGTVGRFCSTACWYAAPGKKELEPKTCPVCDIEFQPTAATQKTCSVACGNELKRAPRNTHCERCGEPLRSGIQPGVRFCSKTCGLLERAARSEERSLGSTMAGPSGYRLVKVGREYPSAHSTGWMLEHRHVMEQKLGRHLRADERVHHKNGVRDDNRSENLELWVIPPDNRRKKDPAGQRVADLVAFVVANYRPLVLAELAATE